MNKEAVELAIKMNIVNHHLYRGQDLGEMTSKAGYEYVFAGNGVFLRCDTPIIKGAFKIAHIKIASLCPFKDVGITLKIPKISGALLTEICKEVVSGSKKESFYQVKRISDSAYAVVKPSQESGEEWVKYKNADPKDVVAEIHSHPDMEAFYSSGDDDDEQGSKIYGVIGWYSKEEVTMRFRIGVYGHWVEVAAEDVFSCVE